jgi:hypothetical protein
MRAPSREPRKIIRKQDNEVDFSDSGGVWYVLRAIACGSTLLDPYLSGSVYQAGSHLRSVRGDGGGGFGYRLAQVRQGVKPFRNRYSPRALIRLAQRFY